jgi:hypothetical protein
MDYNAQDLSGIPADDAMVQLELKRKLAMADALRNQEAPQGQMVSGHYVAPSWTQALAGLANKYVAGQQEQDAMKQYGLAQQSKSAKIGALLSDLQKGKETTTTDNTPYQIQIPSGPESTSMDNLGGMQPINKKTIDVPMTNTSTSYTPYSQQEYMAKIGAVMPDMLPKMLETQFAQRFKENTPIKGSAGDVFFDPITHQPIMTVPEKADKARNIQYEKVREGTQEVTYQINPDGTRVKIASGSAFAPEKPQPDPWHFNDKPSSPITNSKGWILHADANGNKAYVSPDGKSFEEAK